MDGNFVCAADPEKIVVWNARNGKYIKTLPIPEHYNTRDDPSEMHDRWKGNVSRNNPHV